MNLKPLALAHISYILHHISAAGDLKSYNVFYSIVEAVLAVFAEQNWELRKTKILSFG